MTVNDDPNPSTSATIGFVGAAAVFTIGAIWLYRPMLHQADPRHGKHHEKTEQQRRTTSKTARQGATP